MIWHVGSSCTQQRRPRLGRVASLAGASSSKGSFDNSMNGTTTARNTALAAAPARKARRVPVPRIWPVTANDVYAILGGLIVQLAGARLALALDAVSWAIPAANKHGVTSLSISQLTKIYTCNTSGPNTGKPIAPSAR